MPAVRRALEPRKCLGQRDQTVRLEIRVNNPHRILGMVHRRIDREPVQLRAEIKVEHRLHRRQLGLHIRLGQDGLAHRRFAQGIDIHARQQGGFGGHIFAAERSGPACRRCRAHRHRAQEEKVSFHKISVFQHFASLTIVFDRSNELTSAAPIWLQLVTPFMEAELAPAFRAAATNSPAKSAQTPLSARSRCAPPRSSWPSGPAPASWSFLPLQPAAAAPDFAPRPPPAPLQPPAC